jgi:hypothetical protein
MIVCSASGVHHSSVSVLDCCGRALRLSSGFSLDALCVQPLEHHFTPVLKPSLRGSVHLFRAPAVSVSMSVRVEPWKRGDQLVNARGLAPVRSERALRKGPVESLRMLEGSEFEVSGITARNVNLSHERW